MDIKASTTPVVIKGYDFTGIQLTHQSGGAADITITDCLFDSGGVHINLAWGGATKLTLTYNHFKNSQNTEGVVNWAPTGTNPVATYLFNWFDNCPGDGPNAKRGSMIDFRYNLMVNQGSGNQPHSDQFTLAEGAITFQHCTFDYNTNIVNSVFAPATGSQGFTLQGNSHYAAFLTNGGSVSNNTWINTSTSTDHSAGIIFGVWLDCSTCATGKTWVVANNYVDDIGFRRMGYANYEWLRVSQTGIGPQHGTVNAHDNLDLRDGTKPARFNKLFQG